MQILTILPKSWTLNKIQDEFGVTNYTARKAKKLVKENGVLSSPNPKPGKALDATTAKAVSDFYENEEISRCMPGKKDFVSVKVNEKRQHVQIKLILCNLREAFVTFKERFPQFKLGFSKFCEFRPKHCVLAGSSGIHNICVCLIHQNAKLMISQCKLPEFSESKKPIKTYKDILMCIICQAPNDACYFQECSNCPGIENLRLRFEETFALNFIENITYKQWIKSDKGMALETFVKPVEEFISIFFDNLTKLLQHSFLSKQQSSYFTHLKEVLKAGEYLITCDFSENYSFILQDVVQSFHWNNAQATIHPFSIYYQDQTTKVLCHLSFVVISDCLIHDNVAVHLFQRYLINFLQSYFATIPTKIYYYSDGAGSQYKNRFNFINLCFHEADFNIKAEWHFFATSHGKNACDGIGGTVKRLAARSSLQMIYDNQIMTPRQLYEWAKENVESIHFAYSTIEEYKAEEIKLKTRIATARTIPGTHKLHSFVPLNKKQIQAKTYSFSSKSRIENVSTFVGELEFSDLVGFLTCKYGEHWWLGCVLNSDEETQTVKFKFLHPHGPSPSYKYPEFEDILWVHKMDILTKVDPQLNLSGRVYSLTKEETEFANLKLKNN